MQKSKIAKLARSAFRTLYPFRLEGLEEGRYDNTRMMDAVKAGINVVLLDQCKTGEGPVDPQTGRPLGDHGTASQAIQFALEVHDNTLQTYEFLKAWQHGSLDEWPEYYEWLNEGAGK